MAFFIGIITRVCRPHEEEVELLRMEDRGSRTETTPGAPGGSRRRRDSTVGILRLDLAGPRHGSAGSTAQGCGEPVSPQPSVLSVTFAADETNMDKVRFEPDNAPSEGEEEEEEDEDYSASVSAIIQRKASCRRSRRGRRSSSPATDVTSADHRSRRRSSVFTTSSGDTAISMAQEAVEEQIMQNIKVHKEVLSSVKQQPWNMRRKLRLVRQAKAYIRRHEGELQERLAQSRSTRDILARFNIVIIKYWQQTKRELANTMNVLIPWEIRIKEIESHFGSVVASYFTFLRWLFWVNLVTAVVLIVFVAVPEMLMANTKKAGMRKKMMDDEKANSTNLFTLWDFEGVLKYSPMFYGYYSHQDPEEKSLAKSISYTMPLAYFLTELIVYIYSFVAILRRMAENSRQSKLSEKDDECIFTWKLFTGWDYMIGNSETSHNRTASIILGFKEALLEEAEKKRDEGRNWKVTGLRVFAHLNVVWLLGSSVYAVILVVDRSTRPEAEHGWWRRNEITIVVSLITSLFPMFFEGLGYIEQYHPRKKLRMQLGRIMVLNLMNLYTLIFASFSKINEMSTILQGLRPKNGSLMYRQFPTAAPQIAPIIQHVGSTVLISSSEDQTSHSIFNSYQTVEECKNITVPCSTTQTIGLVSITLSVLANFTLPTSNSTGLSSSLPHSPYPTSDSSFEHFKEPTQFTNFSETTESLFKVNSSLENSTISDEDFLPINMFLDLRENSQNEPEDIFEFININNETTEDYNGTNTIDFTTGARESQDITTESTVYTNTISTTQSSYFDEIQSTTKSDETSDSSLFHSSDSNVGNDESSTLFYGLSQTSTLSSPSEELCVELVCETIPVTTDFVDIIQTTSNPPPGAQDQEVQYTDLTAYIDTLDVETRKKLRPLCWETMFGREMVKLTVMDLVMTVSGILMVDFFRAVFVRAMNNCWCWDLEKEFPKYGDFKIAENILHLVNNQGMVWMGMFFSPGLPLINIIKLAIMMYLRSWAVLTCNVPHEVVFRASRSNNFYLALLLTMLFLCVLPVGYAVVWVVPSWHCGPFSNYHRIYHIFTRSLKKALPYKKVHLAFDYMASPGIVIPLLMLLVLIIYYLISLTSALREANNDLKIQLRQERTEERRKMFQLVNKKQKEVQEVEHSVKKWKKIIPHSYHKPSIADIPIDVLKSKVLSSINGSAKYSSKHRDIVDEIVKKTKRMPSGTSEEDNNFLIDAEDVTDIEQHDSLPYDGFKGSKPLDLSPEIRNKPNKLFQKVDKESKSSKKNGHGKNKVYSKDKEDSITSGWSDIPEIRIIETGSTDKINEINDNIKLPNISPNLDERQKYPEQKKSFKPNGKKGMESQQKRGEEEKDHDEKGVKDRKGVKISTTKTDNVSFIEMDSSVPKGSCDNLPALYSKGTTSTDNSDVENDGLDINHRERSSDCIKINQSTFKHNHAPKPDPLDSKSTNKSGKIKKNAFKPKQSGNQVSNKSNLSNSNKATKNGSSSLLTHMSKIKDVKESKLKGDIKENTSSESEEENVISTDNIKSSKSHELSFHIESDYEEGSGTENDEGSNSDERGESIQRKQTKKQKTSLKEREDSDSGDSELSSRSTVKQIDINVKKNNNGETNKVKRKKEGIHREECSKKHTEYPSDNKRTVARFKIAKVLLNEARRRSSAGLEDK